MALSPIHKIPTNVYGHLGPQAAIKRITEVLEAQNGTTASAAGRFWTRWSMICSCCPHCDSRC